MTLDEGQLDDPALTRKQWLALRARLIGKEVPDQTPVEAPLIRVPPSIAELVRMHVKQELERAGVEQGYGTFAEEDDFEDDFDDMTSGYEEDQLDWVDEGEAPSSSHADRGPEGADPVPEGDADSARDSPTDSTST